MKVLHAAIDYPPRTGLTRHTRYLCVLLLGLLAIFEPPLFFFQRYSLLGMNKAVIAAATLLLAVLLLRSFSIPKSAAQLGFVIIFQAALLVALPFLHQTFGYGFDSGYFNIAFQILAGLSLFLIFASAGQVSLLAKFWVNLHLIVGAGSLVVFIAGIVVNLEPVTAFSDRPYYDFGLAYTNVFYQVGSVKIIRTAGFYDEPGTFAFYMTFALILARQFGMPKWKEFALIAFSLTSLSMAFIAVAGIWLLFAANKQQYKYLVILSIALTYAFSYVDSDVRDRIYESTINRFAVSNSEGRILKGDNRTVIMTSNYKAFLDAPFIGHGVHHEFYIGDKYGSSFIGNPVAPLATHGLLGGLIMNLHVFLLLLLIAKTKILNKRDAMAILIVLLATLAQRPTTVHGMGYVLFVVMIYQLLGGDAKTHKPPLARAPYVLKPANYSNP